MDSTMNTSMKYSSMNRSLPLSAKSLVYSGPIGDINHRLLLINSYQACSIGEMTLCSVQLRKYLPCGTAMQDKGSGEFASASFTGKNIKGGSASIFTFNFNNSAATSGAGAIRCVVLIPEVDTFVSLLTE